jgi:mono/diheme cytochrome c family protein
MKNQILKTLLVAMMPLLPAMAADDADIPPPDQTAGVDLKDAAVIEKGMAMLSSTCGGYCHGTEGRGFKAPSLRNRPELTVDGMRNTILNGRKRSGKLMPPWKGVLSDQEVWTVIAAIVSLRHVPVEADGDASKH